MFKTNQMVRAWFVFLLGFVCWLLYFFCVFRWQINRVGNDVFALSHSVIPKVRFMFLIFHYLSFMIFALFLFSCVCARSNLECRLLEPILAVLLLKQSFWPACWWLFSWGSPCLVCGFYAISSFSFVSDYRDSKETARRICNPCLLGMHLSLLCDLLASQLHYFIFAIWDLVLLRHQAARAQAVQLEELHRICSIFTAMFSTFLQRSDSSSHYVQIFWASVFIVLRLFFGLLDQ